MTPVREIFSGELRRKTLIAIGLSAVALLGTWGSVQWVPYWVDKTLAPNDPAAKSLTQIWSSLGAIVGCMIAPLLGGQLGPATGLFWHVPRDPDHEPLHVPRSQVL